MTPQFLSACITAAIAVLLFMTIAFAVASAVRRNDVVDIAWGFGFILVACVTYFLFGNAYPKQLLVTVLVLIWGIRLSVHIYLRNKNRGEDRRYVEYRRKWKRFFYVRTYIQIFLAQGLLLLVISLPILVINSMAGPELTWLDGIGFMLWAVGFYFEAFGDKKGSILQWWGIFLMAFLI